MLREVFNVQATCLPNNTDGWYNGLHTGNVESMVFIDLTKALNSVDYQILSGKFETCGVLQ